MKYNWCTNCEVKWSNSEDKERFKYKLPVYTVNDS